MTYSLTVPKEHAKGNASLRVSLWSLWGALRIPGVTAWNIAVSLGDATSEEYIHGEMVFND